MRDFLAAGILLIPVLVLIIVAAGLYAVYRYKRFQHLAVHEPEMMYRSAWLEPAALADVIGKYQIRAVMNVCKPGEMGEERWIAERHAVKHAGARLLELEMPLKVTADFDDSRIAAQLEALGDPDNYPMLVHCQHGVTRTAKTLLLYDVLYRGMSAEKSLNEMPLFGREQQNVHVRAFAREIDENRETLIASRAAESLAVLR